MREAAAAFIIARSVFCIERQPTTRLVEPARELMAADATLEAHVANIGLPPHAPYYRPRARSFAGVLSASLRT